MSLVAFIRRVKVKGRTYYQRVRTYRDKQGKVRRQVLEHLGPNPPGDGRRLEGLAAALVADEIVKREPTQEEVRRLLESLDVPTGEWDIHALGIEVDLLKKTRHLRLR